MKNLVPTTELFERSRNPIKIVINITITDNERWQCLVSIVCRFKSSKNDHVIQVKPYDDLDFVCPYHPRHESAEAEREEAEEEVDDAEGYYTVYMVRKTPWLTW